jgi:hypothetical protein
VWDVTSHCPVVSGRGLKGLLRQSAITHLVELSVLQTTDDSQLLMAITEDLSPVPSVIQDVLTQFKQLFAEPWSLPPRRAIDHKIPLIPGAQPVNIRPYHYSPYQKTEIEKQVNEMLQS